MGAWADRSRRRARLGRSGDLGKSEEFGETGQPEQIESAGRPLPAGFDSMAKYRNKAQVIVAINDARRSSKTPN